MSTVRRIALSTVLVLGAVTLTGPTPRSDDGNWERLRSMPQEQRAHLAGRLKAFDLLDLKEQDSIRAIDRRLAAEPEDNRANYYSALRRYHLWFQTLSESQRNELGAAAPEKRLELVSRIRSEQRASAGQDAAFYQGTDFVGVSPYEIARVVRVWLSLSPADQATYAKLPEPDRRNRLVQLGRERKLPPIIRPSLAEAEKVYERAVKDRRFPYLKKKVEEAKPQARDNLKQRVADHYSFLEKPPPKVSPDRLLAFARGMPPWIRSGYDSLPPEEARRRVAIIYRLIFPEGSEFKPTPVSTAGAKDPKVVKPPSSPPRRASPNRAARTEQPPGAGLRAGQESTRVTDDDQRWMRRALAEAELGRGRVEPNPMVGAVVVRRGEVVGIGHHPRFGGPHAEIVALEQAGASARGAALYVTLEPCCHHGKTPPCTEAVLAAGVSRVVAAMRDPFPRVAGGGLSRLEGAGVAVEVGLEAGLARRLNAPYLKRLATGMPYVTAKWAMTLDGKIATSTGDSRWISGTRSRAIVHEVRGVMDAIVVGVGTALADDPSLTARPPGARTAARVVLDSAARLPTTSRLARTARETPVWVAVTGRAPADRLDALAALGCGILAFPGDKAVPIETLLQELGRRGLTNVLVEGGGGVLGSFLDAEQIDAVDVFVCPVLEGGARSVTPVAGAGVWTMAEALRLDHHEITVVDGDVRVRGTFSPRWFAEFDSP